MKPGGITFLLIALPVLGIADDLGGLREALTHHVSFDDSLQADFSRGDPGLHETSGTDKGTRAIRGPSAPELLHFEKSGRHGRWLRFLRTHPGQLFYPGPGVFDYSTRSWSGTVSVWLRVNPDDDIPAGYCDPIMITAGDAKAGFMFLEWSPKVPRRFRFAILPRQELWNPAGTFWEDIPADRRPMVEMAAAPFVRDRWTQVVFTFEKINEGPAGIGRLYVDGQLQGEIKGWNQVFNWDPAQIRLVIGRGYVGGMDDLAVFSRALDAHEVRLLYELPRGVVALTDVARK